MASNYGFGKTVSCAFDEAIQRVTAALQTEGFGILSDVDVAATLKKKLNADMPAYRILGACNPALAQRAIQAEPSIGLLLPCNVLVREVADGNASVEFMDTDAVLQLVGKPYIAALAGEVRERLQRVMAAV